MIHVRKDYDHIQDPSGKIPDDEPVFLFRGQDETAPKILRKWAGLNDYNCGDPKMSKMARDHANLMEARPVSKQADLPA